MPDVRGEVQYWFEVTAVPEGGAPAEVRADWVGVVLPVRRPRPMEGPDAKVGRDVLDHTRRNVIPDGVVVEFADALELLRLFGREEAAAWWEGWSRARARTAPLVFRAWEGRLLPTGYVERRYPEVAGFGEG
jgi:hypothetical protein